MKKIISLGLAIVMTLLSAVAVGAAFDPYAQNGYDPNLLRVVVAPRDELAPATWTGNNGHYVTPANTIDTESTVEFRVMVGPRKNSAVWVRHLFVMTEADYQLMDIANFRWFDGSLIEAK